MRKIKRALISVSDKSGLIAFARALHQRKIRILSTGGTLNALKAAGIPAIAVDAVTGFPEIMDGRVKTLHPLIHGALLYRRGKTAHRAQAKQHGIEAIDLVVVNLYPFEAVSRKTNVRLEEAVENIDIGGPSMLRSAAKNHESVTVVCDPADYEEVLRDMKRHKGAVSKSLRRKLTVKAFEKTSLYDAAITQFLKARYESPAERKHEAAEHLPEVLEVPYKQSRGLRYGENPHQRAALYVRAAGEPRLQYEQLHGKELSYNNLLDIESTIDIIREFTKPVACVVKHTNPCGVAEAESMTEALGQAIECDSMSAFGGIIGINRKCTLQAAKRAFEMLKFFEVFVAPSFDQAAVKFMRQRKNLRLIATGTLGDGGPYDMRFLKSGILLQDRDRPVRLDMNRLTRNLKFVTKAKLPASEIPDLIFAWKCVKVVKSNAIVITQGRKTVGIGAGQMSRVDSVDIACRKAGYRTEGALLASDAFFPMPDSIEAAHDHRIRAIIQPGGSVRDADVIAACDRFGIAMAFTGRRHFRH